MYFGNLHNKELLNFHKIYSRNFSISLTNILSNDLFKVETIISNSLYRIYPLFYCENITSSNPDDKIIDTKCLIVNKNSTETYFTFKNNDSDEVIVFSQTNTPFDIGDNLTVSEYNAIVQLLRNHNNVQEEINIKNSLVNGDYGTYIFNLESTTIIDTGILITHETLSHIGTVRLTKPIFKNSDYYLDLEVVSFSDVNIGENNADNIEKTNLTVKLVKDENVTIPFDTLELDNIVSFNACVRVEHKENIVQYPQGVNLFVSETTHVANTPVILSVEYLDSNNDPVEDETITFKTPGGTVLGTAVTDSEGIASLNYIPTTTGFLNIIAMDNYQNVSEELSIEIVESTTSLSLSANNTSIYIHNSVTLSGLLKNNLDNPITNARVKLYNNNNLIATLITDNEGVFTKTITYDNDCENNFQAVFEGTSVYDATVSSFVYVKVNKYLSSFSNVSGNGSWSNHNITISGYLTLNGVAVNNTSVKIYQGSTLNSTVTTNTSGYFSKTISVGSAGTYTLKAVYEGSGEYESSNVTKSVTIYAQSTNITFNISKETCNVGENITLSGVLKAGNTPLPNKNITIANQDGTATANVTTDSNGAFSTTITPSSVGSYRYQARFFGDNWYGTSFSSNVYLTVKMVSSITLSLNGSSSATLNAYQTYNGNAVLSGTVNVGSNKNVKIYQNNTLLKTVKSDDSGAFSTSVRGVVDATTTYYAVLDGADYYDAATSSTCSLTVTRIPTHVHDERITLGTSNSFSIVLVGIMGANVELIMTHPQGTIEATDSGGTKHTTIIPRTGGSRYTVSFENVDVVSFKLIFNGIDEWQGDAWQPLTWTSS